MVIQEMVREAQTLTNDAGLAVNTMRPDDAQQKLWELYEFLDHELPKQDPAKPAEPETAQEPEASEIETDSDTDEFTAQREAAEQEAAEKDDAVGGAKKTGADAQTFEE